MGKKIATISFYLLLGVLTATVAPSLTQQITQATTLNLTGEFDGNIGYKLPDQDATIIGTISGTYEIRDKGGIFSGDWATDNRTGTFRGVFGKNILIGKIATLVDGTEKSLPIVGFYGGKNGQFIGRFMAPVGPALYCWGNYT
jgi:hypothetical protein